jgi:UDP-glucose 4-epimerase
MVSDAAGASPDGSIGEDHNPETHLIPLVLWKTIISTKRNWHKGHPLGYNSK